jgi:hypothetical protein
MTLNETVRLAAAIIGKSACRRDIEIAFYERESEDRRRGRLNLSQNKQNRQTLVRFKAALRKLRGEFMKLPDALRHPLMSSQFDGHCAVWVEICDKLLARRPDKPRRNAASKRLAATQALRLLTKYDKPVETKRNGAWCKLAAVLYGEKNADLRRYCRALRDSANPGSK